MIYVLLVIFYISRLEDQRVYVLSGRGVVGGVGFLTRSFILSCTRITFAFLNVRSWLVFRNAKSAPEEGREATWAAHCTGDIGETRAFFLSIYKDVCSLDKIRPHYFTTEFLVDCRSAEFLNRTARAYLSTRQSNLSFFMESVSILWVFECLLSQPLAWSETRMSRRRNGAQLQYLLLLATMRSDYIEKRRS